MILKITQLSAPWETYYKKLQALLGEDPEISLKFDKAAGVIEIYVDNAKKADALDRLLIARKVFGNVKISITVIPSNKVYHGEYEDLYDCAFDGNPVFVGTQYASLPEGGDLSYVIWSREVAQFFNDNLADYQGNQTMLYEQIARDVLKYEPAVYHCTE